MGRSVCPDRIALEKLTNGKLSDKLAAHLTEHVEGCETCQRTLETIREGQLTTDTKADNSEVSETESLAGQQLAHYQIRRELGRGAMGTVYLAFDTKLEREVALKVPQFGNTVDKVSLERFYREARSAATLRHPGICPVYDVGEVDGQHYIAMAYIEGRPLSVFTKSSKRQGIRSAVGVIRKLSLALADAHAHGVVHRDLKPANVMIDGRNEPVVMDFGLARVANDADEKLTHTGTVIGTPAYMSPEQVEAEGDIGPQTDIYSLGVMLYELLAGERPFQGKLLSLLTQIASRDPAPPSTHRSEIDADLEAICMKMMAKQKEDRFESMNGVTAALTKWMKHQRGGTKREEPQAQTPAETDDIPQHLTPDEFALVSGLKSKGGETAVESSATEDPEPEVDPDATVIGLGDEEVAGLSATFVPKSSATDQPPGKPLSRSLMFGGAAAVLLGAIVLLLLLGDVDVRITIDDDSYTVKVDGDVVELSGDGNPIRLSADKHKLVVERDGLEVKTDSFVVKKDGKNVVHVAVVDGDVSVLKTESAINAHRNAIAGSRARHANAVPADSSTTSEKTDAAHKDDNNNPDVGSSRAIAMRNTQGQSQDDDRASDRKPLKSLSSRDAAAQIIIGGEPSRNGVLSFNEDGVAGVHTVNVPSLKDTTPSLTIELWTRRYKSQWAGSPNPPANSWIAGFGKDRYLGTSSTGRFRFAYSDDTYGRFETQHPLEGSILPVHLAFVRDASAGSARFFVNGRLTDAADVPMVVGDDHFQLCSDRHQNGLDKRRGYMGWIDEVRISSVARYHKDFIPQSRFETDEHTLALYHCDEPNGTVLKDSSGNEHHGEIVGAERVAVSAEMIPQVTGMRTHESAGDEQNRDLELLEFLSNHEATAEIVSSNGRFYVQPNAPAVEEPFTVVGVVTEGLYSKPESLNDEHCEYLAGFPNLQRLDLVSTAITRAGISRLKGFDQLKHLSLPHRLNFVPDLLDQFPQIREFRTPYNYNAAWCVAASRIRGLVALACDGNLSVETLDCLRNHPSLRVLRIQLDPDVASTIDVLSEIPHLECLYLHQNPEEQVAADFATIERLSNLKFLAVDNMESTEKEKLRTQLGAKLPDCELSDQDGFSAERTRILQEESIKTGAPGLIKSSRVNSLSSASQQRNGVLLFNVGSDSTKPHSVTVPTLKDTSASLTIEFWTQRYTDDWERINRPQGNSYIAGFGSIPSVQTSNRGTIGLRTDKSDQHWLSTPHTAYGTELPVHIAAVRDGDAKLTRLFVDGMMVDSTDVALQMGDDCFQLCSEIHQSVAEGAFPYTGWIDDIRISNVARYSEPFVPRRYESDENTLALFYCEGTDENVLTDSSGNEHHGQISGAQRATVPVDLISHTFRLLDAQTLPAQREFAGMVFSNGARAEVVCQGRRLMLEREADIPDATFVVVGIEFEGLGGDPANDDFLAEVPKFPIDRLQLEGTLVQADSLGRLGDTMQIRSLNLPHRMPQCEPGLLKRFPHLRILKLPYDNVADWCAEVQSLPRLVSLDMQHSAASTEAIQQLEGHPGLQVVNCWNQSWDAETLKAFANIPNLKWLGLYGAGKKAADFNGISELRNLKYLAVNNLESAEFEPLTAALAEQLPHCTLLDWRKGGESVYRLVNDPWLKVETQSDLTIDDHRAAALHPMRPATAGSQETWAEKLSIPVNTTVDVGSGRSVDLVLIPPGEFRMGAAEGQIEASVAIAAAAGADSETLDRIRNNEGPQHLVRITKPFLIGRTEITVGQFAAFSDATGYQTIWEGEPNAKTYRKPGFKVEDDTPAAQIHRDDALEFCKWLSGRDGVTYRLPTEAEWEYACRAGSESLYSFGDSETQLRDYAWFEANSNGRLHPAASKKPNAFGLYDFHGSLQEWCLDRFTADAYARSLVDDPQGPNEGQTHVLRGGHWGAGPADCRSTFRRSIGPNYRHSNFGFRIVRELTPTE